MPQAVPLIALAVAAGSAAYQGVNAADQSDKADAAADTQKKAQDQSVQTAQAEQTQQTQEQKDAEASQTADLNATSDKSKQLALAAGAQGRSSTILTSPLGLPGGNGAQPSAPKTLLGA